MLKIHEPSRPDPKPETLLKDPRPPTPPTIGALMNKLGLGGILHCNFDNYNEESPQKNSSGNSLGPYTNFRLVQWQKDGCSQDVVESSRDSTHDLGLNWNGPLPTGP